MGSPGETLHALATTWRLFRGDASAVDDYDNTVGGFWHSFLALVLAAPIVAFQTRVREANMEAAETPPSVDIADLSLGGIVLVHVLAWAIFPLLMIPVVRLIDRSATYVRYIIAHNWASLILIAVSGVPDALLAMGLFGEGAFAFGVLGTFFLQIYFLGYVAAKGLSFGSAVALVMFDFLTGVFSAALGTSLALAIGL